ncbi:MAG: J domain-containing protein [Alphaproteobacteria bacterium]|nr:J domain-containing protein [Alphaproteobacteria bacterium]
MRKSRLTKITALRVTDPPPQTRRCDIPGCNEAGEHRAPKARDRLNQYYWFCLEHVRQYNAAWDYYAGMSIDEIEAHRRADQTWRRPSWPLGGVKGGGKGDRTVRFDLFDGFGLLDDVEIPGANRVHGRQNGGNGQRHGGRDGRGDGAAFGHSPEAENLRRALAVLDLDPPVDFPTIKARYKELAKRHHPDANGGDKAAEERLKVINEAYTVLRVFYMPQGAPQAPGKGAEGRSRAT